MESGWEPFIVWSATFLRDIYKHLQRTGVCSRYPSPGTYLPEDPKDTFPVSWILQAKVEPWEQMCTVLKGSGWSEVGRGSMSPPRGSCGLRTFSIKGYWSQGTTVTCVRVCSPETRWVPNPAAPWALGGSWESQNVKSGLNISQDAELPWGSHCHRHECA